MQGITLNDLMDLADRSLDEPRIASAGDGHAGIALPDRSWVQPGAIIDSATARKFAAQLFLVADEYDAVFDAGVEEVHRAQKISVERAVEAARQARDSRGA
jgi:hypothetical protein